MSVQPSAAGVGESSIDLRAGERLTVHDLLEGALIQSANDAAYALAAYGGKGNVGAFVRDDEREGARAASRATRTTSARTASTRRASTRAPRT